MINHIKKIIGVVFFFITSISISFIQSNTILANVYSNSNYIKINNHISYNSLNDCYYLSDSNNTTAEYTSSEFNYLKDTWSYIGDNWKEHILPMFSNNELKQYIYNKKFNISQIETINTNSLQGEARNTNDNTSFSELDISILKSNNSVNVNDFYKKKSRKNINQVTSIDTVIIY